jgi:hypothetical protein
MLDCVLHFLFSAALETLKQWLRDWGVLLLTAVIALATVMQGMFAMRLYRLQQAIERSRLEPLLYCRVKGHGIGVIFTRLDVELSNLSTYGVWIEEMVIVLNGPMSCNPEQVREVGTVLAASQTQRTMLFSVPFTEIIPLGSGSPAGPVTFKLQVKFYYSTASTIGIQTSPLYEVTILGTVVTSMKVVGETK